MHNLTAAMNEIIAANVKMLRERLGLTQVEFADELEVAQATVSRWEKGTEPEARPLTRLAEMAQCSVSEFTTRLLTSRRRVGDIGGAPTEWKTLLLPVYLPSEEELSSMFSGLLEPLKDEKNWDVLALRLAQRLPIALAQTVSRSSALQSGQMRMLREEGPPAQPPANPER